MRFEFLRRLARRWLSWVAVHFSLVEVYTALQPRRQPTSMSIQDCSSTIYSWYSLTMKSWKCLTTYWITKRHLFPEDRTSEQTVRVSADMMLPTQATAQCAMNSNRPWWLSLHHLRRWSSAGNCIGLPHHDVINLTTNSALENKEMLPLTRTQLMSKPLICKINTVF